MDMIEDMDTNEKGPGKNKRKWIDAKDKELVYALLDMVNAGTHKTDNEFKPGFLGVIEAVLKKKLHGSGINAKPHIYSRIKIMKKDFDVVYGMLNRENCSGFGWDPHKNVEVAKDEVWNGYVKTHKGDGQWRSRSFPHYEKFCTIFRNDHATGKGAVTIEEATMIIGNKIDEATEKFSQAIGVDLDIANKMDKINDELHKLPNLSRAECHKTLIATDRDHEMIALFFLLWKMMSKKTL